MENNNEWQDWSKYVLKELERLNNCYSSLDTKMQKVREDIATLNVKAGLWGVLGGVAVMVGGIIISFFKNGFAK